MDGPKSQICEKFALVTFISKTKRNVDVFWLDYNGRRVKYGTLGSRGLLDVTTYETHPWMFRDSDTGDKIVVRGGKEVYYPVQWTGGERVFVHIDIPAYTLRDRCLQVVRKLYTNEELQAFMIPTTLKDDAAHPENVPHDVYMYFEPDL